MPGVATAQYFDKAIGHLIEWQGGVRQDDESGVTPLAHAVADIMILLTLEAKNGGDTVDG